MSLNIQVKNVEKEFKRVKFERENITRKQFSKKIIRLFQDLRSSTPVLTGRARDSWNASLNSNDKIDAGNGQTSILPHSILSTMQIDDPLYISNGVPYIQHLNNGSSKQAPKRFIEKAILRNL